MAGGRIRKSIVWLAVAISSVAGVAQMADAKIRIEPGKHLFYFHGNLGAAKKGGPGRWLLTSGVTIRAYNKADDGTITPIASVSLPVGACRDRGNNCVYSNPAARTTNSGIAKFKMSFTSGKIWMTSYGQVATTTNSYIYVDVIFPQTATTPLRVAEVHAYFTATANGWLLSDHDPQW